MPNLLAAGTTGLGFATLTIADVPAIRDFGGVIALAMLISWITTYLLMPPLLLLLPLATARPWVLGRADWVPYILKWRKPLVLTTVALALFFTFTGKDLHWSARLFDDLPAKREARLATERIDRKMGGMITLELLIGLKQGNDPWKDPKTLNQLDKLIQKLRDKKGIGSVVGLPDLVRQALGNPRAQLPNSRAAVAEKLFLIGMSEENLLPQFLSPDGRTARISLRLHDEPSHRIEQLLNQTRKEAKTLFPTAQVRSGGMATTVHRLNNSLSKELMFGFWQALGAICLLLLLVFRSWRWTVMAALPNLIPAAALLGVLAMTKTPIKPGVALVFSIALGFAFDNTIYLLQRLRSLMKASGRSAAEEIENALKVEGNPCFVSTLCLLSGFCVFLFSEFDINRTFGMYMLVALAVGSLSDVLFMPALIRWAPWILNDKAEPVAPRPAPIVVPDEHQDAHQVA